MFTITEVHRYRLQFVGTLDEDDLSRYCPAGVKVERAGALTTLGQVDADQAALIGLLRHLHNAGCVIVRVQVEADGNPSSDQGGAPATAGCRSTAPGVSLA